MNKGLKKLIVAFDYEGTANTLHPIALGKLLGLIEKETRGLVSKIGFIILTGRHKAPPHILQPFLSVSQLSAMVLIPREEEGILPIAKERFFPLGDRTTFERFSEEFQGADFAVVDDDPRGAGLVKFEQLGKFLGQSGVSYSRRVFEFSQGPENSRELTQEQMEIAVKIAQALKEEASISA